MGPFWATTVQREQNKQGETLRDWHFNRLNFDLVSYLFSHNWEIFIAAESFIFMGGGEQSCIWAKSTPVKGGDGTKSLITTEYNCTCPWKARGSKVIPDSSAIIFFSRSSHLCTPASGLCLESEHSAYYASCSPGPQSLWSQLHGVALSLCFLPQPVSHVPFFQPWCLDNTILTAQTLESGEECKIFSTTSPCYPKESSLSFHFIAPYVGIENIFSRSEKITLGTIQYMSFLIPNCVHS